MMKLTKILYKTLLLTTISLTSTAVANEPSILGSYKGGGYTLDLNSGGDYHSCDSQNRCLTLSRNQSSQQGKIRIWKNAGYTYRVTSLGQQLKRGQHTRISVKIISPKNQVVFDRIFRSQ
jgi:hypothetical protein